MSNIDPHFPLLDLHRHLDGSVRLATILALGQQHGLPLPGWTLEDLRPFVQVSEPQPGLLAFFEKFKWQTGVLVNEAACYRVAYENVEDAKNEGIDYIELRFSPWFMAEAHGLNPVGVVEAVVAGVQAGVRDFGVAAKLIGILSRTYGPAVGRQELAALLTQRDHIVALDLAGDEINFPGEMFVDHFRQARNAGWGVTVHAGEATGPESIWQAIHGLGATRIGHGMRAVEDAALLDYLAAHAIGLEVSLTSNVQTSVVADYASHPLRRLLAHGVKATLNTDDPGISAIDLPHEYNVAAPQAGLSLAQIHQCQRNALEVAFLSDGERAVIGNR